MNFLIIGGDAAGMSAASRAKRNQPDLNVTVLEKTTDVSYSACGMPYNIADPDREIEDLVVRQAQVFREKQGIRLLTGHCAEKIRPADQTVSGTAADGSDFSFSYDHLLIATGASPIKPEIPGVDLPGVMVLKTLDEGRKIKAFLKAHPVRKAVIIGMGYIALEMCEALHERGIRVDMVKPRPRLLPWMEETLSGVVREELESNGVGVHDGHVIERIEQAEAGLKVACPDLTLEGELVLIAIGVTPNSRIAADAGITPGLSDAIAVNKALQTSAPNIFAAGDCADAVHVVTGEKTWIPLALRANRGGWAVADTVCGKKTELPGIVGTAVFKVFDLQVARTGLTSAEAEKAGFEPAEVMIKSRSRAHRHPNGAPIWVQMVGDRKSGRLLGAQMVGREGAAHRINAPAVALHTRMTVDQFSQSDLAYAPPFGPTWDPLLTAANQLLKKM
ncbi:pyridine nucleotide-disulfide oxidoreductase [Desulfonema ishimotonii]|uniref:Pyridine nucleotide-disulfide oxidoreductase n=1 Tax=Desulfonema ishimotonii TaxID=45657 RepID=A0A401FS19_9BACT|nr:FAD-dependent oxidoreductase [Desulfonema ishimotonii]GBC59756.1 pyridine nucleotide-disulfide oxidoreductase [Desulfonema ishimotonii]